MMDELEAIRAQKMARMLDRAKQTDAQSKREYPIELSDDAFDSAIRGRHLVLLDCWAAWCYPCRMIAPIVEELSREYASAALFAKLNVDDNPVTATKYSIQSIPTILIIKDGAEVERIVGAVPKDHIEAALKRHL